MPSYQDIESRVNTLEAKVAFIMKISQARVQVGHPLDPRGSQEITVTFDQLYQKVQHAGGQIVDLSADPPAATPIIEGETTGTGASIGNVGGPGTDGPTASGNVTLV